MFILDVVAQSYAKETLKDVSKLKKLKLHKNYYISAKQIKELKKMEQQDNNLINYFVSKMIAFYDMEFEKIKQYPKYYTIAKFNGKYFIVWFTDNE